MMTSPSRTSAVASYLVESSVSAVRRLMRPAPEGSLSFCVQRCTLRCAAGLTLYQPPGCGSAPERVSACWRQTSAVFPKARSWRKVAATV